MYTHTQTTFFLLGTSGTASFVVVVALVDGEGPPPGPVFLQLNERLDATKISTQHRQEDRRCRLKIKKWDPSVSSSPSPISYSIDVQPSGGWNRIYFCLLLRNILVYLYLTRSIRWCRVARVVCERRRFFTRWWVAPPFSGHWKNEKREEENI